MPALALPSAGPAPDAASERRSMPLAVVLGVWTCVGVFFTADDYLLAVLFDRDWPDPRTGAYNLQDAYLWAVFTLPILRLQRRFRFTSRWWPVSLGVHLLAAMCFAWACVEIDWAFWRLIAPDEPAGPGAYVTTMSRIFAFNMQWYAVIVGVGYLLDYYRGFKERQVQAARLQTQLTRAQLEALKMQIQPHFLFNTLHSISELVHEDPAAADRMITRLGDLLRLTVDNAGTHEIPLRQEMQFLEAYLEIQRTRFQDTLTVEMDVAPDALDALVPNLVLQPLVENAIRHGIAPRGGPGRIAVSARREGTSLVMEVRDDGAGLAPPRPGRRAGVGVANTRARLEQLYGDGHRFEIAAGEPRGTVARVAIPFRPAEPEDDGGHARAVLARRLAEVAA